MTHFIDYVKKQTNSFLAKALAGFLIRVTGCRKVGSLMFYIIYFIIYCILNYAADTEYGNIWIIIFSAYIPFVMPTLSLYAGYYEMAIHLNEDNTLVNDFMLMSWELIWSILRIYIRGLENVWVGFALFHLLFYFIALFILFCLFKA